MRAGHTAHSRATEAATRRNDGADVARRGRDDLDRRRAGSAPGLGEAALSKAARPAAVPAATAGAAQALLGWTAFARDGLAGSFERRRKPVLPTLGRIATHSIHCGERAVVLGSNQARTTLCR